MVLFKAKAIHFSTTMCFMNKLRQEKTLCDVTLAVGTARISAHRCILAAGSPYFQPLFLGHYKEADMNDINMSEVTEDVDALEMIVNFIYTGEIDINSDNLGIIVKLASFFLIETLRDICIEFMISTLFLETCLRYYLYAVDYGLSDIEAKTAPMVQSRFHDFIIFEEETLKMSPDELLYICRKNIFEHCTSLSLLQFIARWVEKGLTEKHVVVGTLVLDMVNRKGCVPRLCTSDQNLFDRVKSSLERHATKGCDKFLQMFKQMITKSSTQTVTERKSYNLRSHSSSSSSHFQHAVEKEVAILTFSPRPCVVETFKKRKEERKRHSFVTYSTEYVYTCTEPIMDMCAYVPRTKCWYHMHELKDDDLPITLINYPWGFQTLPGDLTFVQIFVEDIVLYNVKSNTWRFLAFEDQIDGYLEHRNLLGDICIVSGNDNGIYLIAKIRMYEDDDLEIPNGMHFRGYKLQEDKQTWQRIFQTPTIDLDIEDFCGQYELRAKISSASNELLVVQSGHGHNVAFVVNLNAETMVPCTILATVDESNIFGNVSILEGKKQLYIVSDGTKNGGGCVTVKFEYRFNSNTLTEVRTSEKIVQQIGDGGLHKDGDPDQCLTEMSAYCGESLWYLEGDREKVSFLTEVTVNRNQSPVIRQHTPPPFSSFVGAFAIEIDADTLTTFKPITKFLDLSR